MGPGEHLELISTPIGLVRKDTEKLLYLTRTPSSLYAGIGGRSEERSAKFHRGVVFNNSIERYVEGSGYRTSTGPQCYK